jgi:hypothetical protein
MYVNSHPHAEYSFIENMYVVCNHRALSEIKIGSVAKMYLKINLKYLQVSGKVESNLNSSK